MPAARDAPKEETPRDAAGWHQRGLEMRKLARHGDAVQAFSKAASLQRVNARYQHDLGVALADDGKPDQAIGAFRRALRLDDTMAEAHNDLGTAYYDKGWYAEAETSFRHAVALKPDHGVAYANLGAALRAQGRLHEGRKAFQRALALKVRAALPAFLRWRVGAASVDGAAELPRGAKDAMRESSEALLAGKPQDALALARRAEERFPGQPDFMYLAATAYEALFDVTAALERIEKAIALKPERAEYHVLHSRLLTVAGKEAAAIEAAQRAVQLDPGSAEAHAALAGASREANADLAERSARKAIELDLESHAAHGSLAAVLWPLGRLDEAIAHAREALRLAPRAPLYPLNLAVVLRDAGQIDEARRIYRQAIANPPNHAGALLNLGALALSCEGDVAAARGWYAKCLALGPDDRATQSESILDLLEGRFESAWPKYETRKRAAGHRERHAPFSGVPAWDGRRLDAARLLVYGEQGLGDEIMFVSMLPDTRARVSTIELACDLRLAPLFARSFSGVTVTPVATDKATPLQGTPDFAVAMGSLGQFFRLRPADFPEHRGYLVADPEKSTRWRERLATLGAGRRIGLSWRGGVPSTGRARRSLTPRQLEALIALPGAQWISLQYGDTRDDLKGYEDRIHVFPGAADDLDELAALVSALDLVVSVCNVTVHIAGAIGKEVLVMAPFLPEWRYGMRGERMLWYPSARVFRQPAMGDWESVISAVKARLG